MKEKLFEPKEKIYLLLYSEPCNVENICQTLYGKKRNSRVSGWIKELYEKDKIKPIFKTDFRKHYFQATPKWLFDSICNDLENIRKKLNKLKKEKDIKFNFELDSDEKKRLLILLDHEVFRKFVYSLSKRVEQISGLDSPSFNLSMIKNQFSHYCAFLFWFELWRVRSKCIDEHKDIKDNFDEYLEQAFKRYKAKKDFQNLSEGILSLGVFSLDKLLHLDYLTSTTLIAYLTKLYDLVPEWGTVFLAHTPLSELQPEEDFLDFF